LAKNNEIEEKRTWRKEKLKEKENLILAWVKETQNGNTEAFSQIYHHLKNRLFSLAYRYTYNREAAEDILQETFIKIYSKMSTINQPETFLPWAYRVTINTALSYLRRHRKYFHSTISQEEREIEIEDTTGIDSLNNSEALLRQTIEAAIRSLPPGLKTIFLLHDVQGFTHEEIAAILGCTVGTSKSQLFKARVKIRDFLQQREINHRSQKP